MRPILVTLACVMIAIASTACGDDDGSGTPTDAGDGDTDAGSTGRDAGPAAGDDAGPGGDDAGGSTDGGGSIDATCTLVIGYSQVNEWYNGGGVFESVVDDDRWELLWNGGAGVDRWQMADYTGWDNMIRSPCTMNRDAPERVLLSISGPFGDDEAGWAAAIRGSIDQIRAHYPSVRQIILQPVVGGPMHMACMRGGGRIRASWQHAHVDAAIAMVVGGDVVAGASPEVRDCSDYEDMLGHLTDDGARAAGQTLGDFYLAF